MTYLGDLQPAHIGVIIHLLSTMDIPVRGCGENMRIDSSPGIKSHFFKSWFLRGIGKQ